jgi:hypothetical protein
MATLRYVSSPAAVELQTYYSAASSGFTTYSPRGSADGTQPSGTAFSQSIVLQDSPWNVVDISVTTWLESWIAAYTADPLLSQIAINGSDFPPPYATPGTVLPP